MAKRKQRRLAVDAWPAADRRAWTATNLPGGLGAEWGARMRDSARVSYVWWLLHLEATESLDRDTEPLDRVTPERIDGFVCMLQQCKPSPSSVHHHVSHLAQALRVMVPGAERDWLKAEVRRLNKLAKGSDEESIEPIRRHVPFEAWPLLDQQRWAAAIGPGGLAAHWAPATRKGVLENHGRVLSYLEHEGRLDPDAAPEARLAPDLVEGFVHAMQAAYAPASVRSNLKKVSEALRVMAPDVDLRWLNQRLAELAPKTSTSQKRPEDDPSRRCMPLEEWPPTDRQAWAEAISPGNLLLDGGAAATWRQPTRKMVIKRYGRFLTYLQVTGHLDPTATPAERIAHDVVKDYVRKLQQECASVTVQGYVRDLVRALCVMAPEADLAWHRRRARALKTRSRVSRNKRARIVPAEELLELGVDLMDEALDEDISRRRWAVQYRDGLTIALLVCRPIRLRSLALLRVGQHLVKTTAAGYEIRLAEDEIKVGGPLAHRLPDMLTPLIDHYLNEVRPLLAGPARDDHLWLAWKGGALSDRQIYHQLTTRTAKAFGKKVNPQLFRDCAATSVAIDDPAHIAIVMPLLGHTTLRTSERHYNQARGVDASRTFGSMVRGKRRNIKKARRKPRRPNPEGDPCAP